MRRSGMVAAGALALALAFAACSSSSSSKKESSGNEKPDGTTTTAPSGPVYEGPGPYAVGVTTLTIGDRDVEVWYPAPTDAVEGATKDVYFIKDWLAPNLAALLPAEVNPPFETDAYREVAASDEGPFPLVLFSHGFRGYRDQSTLLTTHLASWGFVVAAPDHRERSLEFVLGGGPEPPRDDVEVMRAVVDAVRTASDDEDNVLAGTVRDGDIGIFGHSAGGVTTIRFAAEPDVAVFVPLASGARLDETSPTIDLPDKPSMFLAGSIDTVVPVAVSQATFDVADPPTRLAIIEGAGHLNGFSDICEIGTSGGGVVAIAKDAGFPIPAELERLGTDGCQEGAAATADVVPVVNHYVTAMMRYYLGVDDEPVGLEPSVADDFPVAVKYEERL